MKRFACNILVIPLLVVYLTAVEGVTIHECAADSTVELLGVLAEQTAECPHSHNGCPQASQAGGHHHDGVSLCEAKCCHDSIYALEQAQRTSEDDYSKLTDCAPAFYFAMVALLSAPPVVPPPAFRTLARPQGCLSGKTIITLYSVLRA